MNGNDTLYIATFISGNRYIYKYTISTEIDSRIYTFPSNLGSFESYYMSYFNNGIYFFFINEGTAYYMYRFNLSNNTMAKIDNTDYRSIVVSSSSIYWGQASIISKYAYFPMNAKYGKLK